MTRSARTRSSFALVAALLATLTLAQRCFALEEIQDVSQENAKKLGFSVRLQLRPDSHDVWVQVEFETTGPTKRFKRADLELTHDGKRLALAALMPRKLTVGRRDAMLVEYYVDPAALADSTVTLVFYTEPRTGVGYRLKLKDVPPSTARR